MFIRCSMICFLSVVLISANTASAEESKLVQKVYAVSDLVVAPVRHEGEAKTSSEDSLIKLITDTISPRSWGERGGRGTIDYHPLTKSLVVCQTVDVQDQIADLLAAERRLLNSEISVEVKFVDVTAKVFRDLQQKGILSKQDKKTHAHGNLAYLDDAEVHRLMEALQDDVRSNVMQAPKLTSRNGQTTAFDLSEKQFFVTGMKIVSRGDRIEYRPKIEFISLGTRLKLRSLISADGRFIRVHLDVKQSNVAAGEIPLFPITTPAPDGKGGTVTQYIQRPRIDKWSIKRTLAIPEGHTTVLTGFKGSLYQVEARNEYGPPILRDIPIVGRLFRTVGYGRETHRLLVLVTPRILAPVEEEAEPHPSESGTALVP